jgi:hypothetical protein
LSRILFPAHNFVTFCGQSWPFGFNSPQRGAMLGLSGMAGRI